MGSFGPNRYCIPLLLRPGKIPSCWALTTVSLTSMLLDQLTINRLRPVHSLQANYVSLPMYLFYCLSYDC
jgi:hypothetical protein